MPLHGMFWGAKLGMPKDAYGSDGERSDAGHASRASVKRIGTLSRGTAGLQLGFDLCKDTFGGYQFSAAGFDPAQSTLDFFLPCWTQLAIRTVL